MTSSVVKWLKTGKPIVNEGKFESLQDEIMRRYNSALKVSANIGRTGERNG